MSAKAMAPRARTVTVDWRLPVGVASVLLYLVRQLRLFPDLSTAVETILRDVLEGAGE